MKKLFIVVLVLAGFLFLVFNGNSYGAENLVVGKDRIISFGKNVPKTLEIPAIYQGEQVVAKIVTGKPMYTLEPDVVTVLIVVQKEIYGKKKIFVAEGKWKVGTKPDIKFVWVPGTVKSVGALKEWFDWYNISSDQRRFVFEKSQPRNLKRGWYRLYIREYLPDFFNI